MSSGGGSSLRKTLGAIKDSTTVSLAKMSSDYKVLDIAIVKATNHVESPPKERHIKAVFAALSAKKPRADVAYCIHALTRRLAKTHNWAVALKTLIVIHRALREADPTFQEEISNYGRSRNNMLNLAHFKDDSSPNAWDYSAWVRCYALYLEERIECFRVLKYDIETDRLRTRELDTPKLLEHMPALQQLLHRALGCQPQGAAYHNLIIQLALSMVASESIKIYNAISDGTVNLVDKFFEMQRHDALKSLDLYRIARQHAERFPQFYEKWKNSERFFKIEQPPASVLQAMEEYVREPRAILASPHVNEGNLESEAKLVNIEPPLPASVPPPPAPDLLGFNDAAPAPAPAPTELDKHNAMALAVLPVEQSTPNGSNVANRTTGWELALVTAPSSNGTVSATSKLAGGLDLFTLDSLYEDAIVRNNPNVSYNPWEQAPTVNNSVAPQHDPFHASNAVAPPPMAKQRHFALQQQQPMMLMRPQDPLGSVYITPHQNGTGMPVQPYNPYSGLI